MIILGYYKLLINTDLLTALLPIFGGRAAMWVNSGFGGQSHPAKSGQGQRLFQLGKKLSGFSIGKNIHLKPKPLDGVQDL
jgi:hypothetical protein